MHAKKSPLEALIEFPKDGPDGSRRDLLRLNTDALVTAPDRYGTRKNSYIDLMFSRATLSMDRKLRRCLAMALTRSNVDKEHVKTLLNGNNKAISLILRGSTTHPIPDLVNMIRERTTSLYCVPQRRPITADDLQDGKRFTLPRLLLEDTFRFIYFSHRANTTSYATEQLSALLDRTAKRYRTEIIDRSQTEIRDELLEVRKEIGRRERHKELTEDYVCELLMTEHRTEFILAMCSLLHVDNTTMQRILNDASWDSLALTCRAAKISRPTFANIVNSMNRRKSDLSNATRIISLYNNIPIDAAERVMRFWQIRAIALSETDESNEINPSVTTSDVATPDTQSNKKCFNTSERKVLFGIT